MIHAFSGLINTFKWGTLAAVPIFVAFPLVNYFHPDVSAWSSMFLVCNADDLRLALCPLARSHHSRSGPGGLHRGVQMWSFIILIYIVRTFVGQLMFCAVMNLINNSVDVYNMGAANGLGTCVRAIHAREWASR